MGAYSIPSETGLLISSVNDSYPKKVRRSGPLRPGVSQLLSSLSGIAPGEEVIRWSADGKDLFVASGSTIPARVYRVEVITGRRQLLYNLAPSDASGLWNIGPILLTPDGKSYVYSDYKILSDLYVASGLR